MTYIKVKVPDGTDISGYDAELRLCKYDELYLNHCGVIVRFNKQDNQRQEIVLTPSGNHQSG